MKKGNIVLGGVFIIIGIVLMAAAFEPHEMLFADPHTMHIMTYPKVLIGIWIIASVFYTIGKKDSTDWGGFHRSKYLLIAVTICIIVYALTFKYLGLPASTFLFLSCFFYAMNYRDPKKAIPIIIVCSFLTWLVFEKLLGIPMPRPFFLDLF